LGKLRVRLQEVRRETTQNIVERREEPVSHQQDDVPPQPRYASAGLSQVIREEMPLRRREHIIAVYVAVIYREGEGARVPRRSNADRERAPHPQKRQGQRGPQALVYRLRYTLSGK